MQTVGVLIIVAAVAVWVVAALRAKEKSLDALRLNGVRPSYTAEGWLHHSLDSLARNYSEHGIKSTLALYDRAPIVRIAVKNKVKDVIDIAFGDIDEVHYVATEKGLALTLSTSAILEIGDTQRSELVLTIKDHGAGDVHAKLCEWLEPNTTLIFHFSEGGRDIKKGRGGAMRA